MIDDALSHAEAAQIVAKTTAQLVPINTDTAARFKAVAGNLSLSADHLKRFSEHSLNIATAGWRSYESLNALLEVAELIEDSGQLPEIARAGEGFAGYSFEPSMRYFQLVAETIRCGKLDVLTAVQFGGQQIQDKYRHASNLISGYFVAALSIVRNYEVADVLLWANVAVALKELQRDEVVSFLSASSQAEKINWRVVEEILRLSKRSCLAYVLGIAVLQNNLHATDRQYLNDLVKRLASQDVQLLFDELSSFKSRQPASFSDLLILIAPLHNVDQICTLLSNADELPLHDRKRLEQWLEIGLEEYSANTRAMTAYLGRESARSISVLERLSGQVNFDDHHRVFDLLSEAVTGRHIPIESVQSSPQALSQSQSLSQYNNLGQQFDQTMPMATGESISLPAVVNIFDQESDNFGFYKVSLLHQLGYVEFGCFDAISEIHTVVENCANRRSAEKLFLIVEDARIDWRLEAEYPGLVMQIYRQKNKAAESRNKRHITRTTQLMEALLLTGLDAGYEHLVSEQYWPDAALLRQWLTSLRDRSTTVSDSLAVFKRCYELIITSEQESDQRAGEVGMRSTLAELPEPVIYRGELDVATVESTLKIEALINELQNELEDAAEDADSNASASSEVNDVDLGNLKDGQVGEGVSLLLTELQNELKLDPDQVAKVDASNKDSLLEFLGGISSRTDEATLHRYDEWDFEIGDYRPRWCTLYEHRELDTDEAYVTRTLIEHADLSRRIRGHLNKIRPQMLRKVKGVTEGDELDIERVISFLVDKKAGLTPDENIYVQRQRKDRDVSTLFLLDMSASTDDIIPDPDTPPIEAPDVDDDEYLVEFFAQQRALEDDARRIIDLEKESVVLMAHALETLGDSYAVCGFSGYGRDQVDYYSCKDFDEGFDAAARGRIGGIKPCRSTRMGAPIRHATRRLMQTESRIKALIIISDGYPQDHDYGTDRNSREYGVMDTMKALSEAKQQGVLSYCLTVDPSGHDYLRAMCPDSQYMVIQDIAQLPEELSRVYRSLTG